MRLLYLPAEVDSSKASATLKDGILIIELPKAAQGQDGAYRSQSCIGVR